MYETPETPERPPPQGRLPASGIAAAPLVTHEELAAAVAGEPAAVRRLVERASPILHAEIKRVAGQHIPSAEVEDTLQVVIVEMFRDSAALLASWDAERKRSLRNYLVVLAQRRALDALRRYRRLVPINEREWAESSTSDAGGEVDSRRAELQAVVDAYLDGCTEVERRFFACTLEDRSVAEVAAEFNLSHEAVYKRRERERNALRALHKKLQSRERL